MEEIRSAERPPTGFVGLGMMGAPIARRLQGAGVPLTVYNRTPEKADPLVAAGAGRADSPRDVGRVASGGIVFTLVSDAKALRAVLFGRNGVARGAGPGTLIVDLSTIAPEESRRAAERLASKGLAFVDAPLGGSVDAAGDGRLLIYVGGDPADVARARPLLDHFARRVEHLGPVGAGSSMKLVNNLVTLSEIALLSEAIAFGDALSLDRDRAIELLLEGGARSRMLENKQEAFRRREYSPRFKLALAAKDLGLIARTARSVGASTRLARETRRLVDEAVRAGLGDRDFSAVFEIVLGRNRGETVPPTGALLPNGSGAAQDPA